MPKIIDHPFHKSHLLLKKLIKYQNKPIFGEEFYKVSIFDFQLLIKYNDQLKSYYEITNEFGMRANNTALY